MWDPGGAPPGWGKLLIVLVVQDWGKIKPTYLKVIFSFVSKCLVQFFDLFLDFLENDLKLREILENHMKSLKSEFFMIFNIFV